MNQLSSTPPTLSLLTAYRGSHRESHLKILLRWLSRVREVEGFVDFELIVVEGDNAPSVENITYKYEWVRYAFILMPQILNKSRLLNRSAEIARGAYLIPFDVDLLPAEGVLQLHLELARASPRCLIAGYRLQIAEALSVELPLPTSDALISSMGIEDTTILCSEDNPRALRKYLLQRQRFGVCPCYPNQLYESLGGCDEGYQGRGPEDQDLVEKACASGLTLVRSYDLLYFHMPHGPAAGWDDPSLLAANRERFARHRQERMMKKDKRTSDKDFSIATD